MFFRLCCAALALCVGLGVSPTHAAQPPVTALAFAPGGKSVVVGSQAGVAVHAWPGLALERELVTSVANVNDLAFSPDGKSLAIAGGSPGEAGMVELASWPAGESLRVLAGHEDCVQSVSWRDDATLASASLDRDVVVWDVPSGELKSRLKGHSRGVSTVCYVSGHPLLVSGSIDQTLRVWNIESGQIARTLNNHTKEVLQVALRPAAEGLPMLASIGEDRTVRFWQPTIGRLVRFAELSAVPLAVDWLNDGSRAVVSSTDGHVRLVDPATAEITEDFPAVDGWAYSLAVHPTDGSVLVGGRSGQLKRVMLESPKAALTPPLSKGGQGGSAHPGVRFAPETVWPAVSLEWQGRSADRIDRVAGNGEEEMPNVQLSTSSIQRNHWKLNVGSRMWEVYQYDTCPPDVALQDERERSSTRRPLPGKILVDGKPTKGIAVTFKRTSAAPADFPVPEPRGETDENGTLVQVSTYISNDGGAPGDYILLFALANRTHQITGELVGDAFKGKYMSMNSEFKITIPESADGKPYDIGTIDLTMK